MNIPCKHKLSLETKDTDSYPLLPTEASKEIHLPIEVSEETYYLLDALSSANMECVCKVVEAILLEEIS
jgi:hypothetical protein